MKRLNREKAANTALRAALIIVLLLVIFAAAAVVSWFIRVDEVYVSGNQYTRPADVKAAYFQSENDSRLLSILVKQVTGQHKIHGIKRIRLKFLSLQSLMLEVEEEPAFCAVPCSDGYLILTESGYVLSVIPESMGVTEIPGLEIGWTGCFEKPVTAEKDQLEALMKLLRYTMDQEIEFDRICYEDDCIIMKMGDVTVNFGSAEDMDEKMATLKLQIPYLEGLKGTLHLDDYRNSLESGRFYFEVTE